MLNRSTIIYVVEDDPAHAEAIRRSLENTENPYEVICIRSVGNFRLAVADRLPDLVLADLNLLDGKAFDLLSNPPERLAYPVLVMTSYGSESLAVQVMKAGALDYVVKSPEVFTDLPHLISRALREWQLIQNHKKAQEELQESEDRYRMLIEQAADGIFISDHSDRYISVNPAGCALLGYSAEEILEKTIGDLVRGENQEVASLGLHDKSPGNSVRAERRLIRKDGSELFVEINARVLTNGSVQSIMRDVTERKRMELILQQNEEFLSLVYKNSDIGIFVVDVSETGEYRYQGINPTHEKLMGVKNETVVGKTPEDLISYFNRDTVDYINALYDQVVTRRETIESEYFVPEGFAKGWWFSRLSPLFDPETGRVIKLMGSGINITERKQAEEALQASEKRFRSLAESALVGIYLADANGNCVYVNDAWCQMAGMSPDEAYGIGWLSGLLPEDRAVIEEKWAGFVAHGGKWEYEYRFVNYQGNISWVYGYAAPLHGSNGTLQGFVGTNVDITERKLAEAKLRESEERFRLLIEHAPEGVFVQIHGQFAYLNPTAYQWFGAENAEQLLGSPVIERFAPRYQSMVAERIRQLNVHGEKVPLSEEAYLRLDGSPFEVEAVAVPVQWEGENGALVFFRDVTERTHTQERIRLQGAALEAAANAIVITNRNGQIEWVNPAFTALTGYPAGEAVGRNPRELVRSGAHDLSFYKDIWDTILSGMVWRGEMINRRKDGSLYTEEQTITPLRDAQGEVARFIAIKQDISDRKKTQAELIQSQQALMQSHAMTQLSLQRLRVLHDIEMAITSQMELDAMANTIIEHVAQLGTLTAGALFVPSGADNGLAIAGIAGFFEEFRTLHLQLPSVFHGHQADQSLQTIYLYSLDSLELDCIVDDRLKSRFHSCVILPLMITDQLKGALLFFSQQAITFDPGWYDFLKSLAFQIALVLDRYTLFQSMEQANENLYQAYEATLEGWSHALELRERETAGHSQRVVRMTMALARELGMSDTEINALRRGALLHDIGKMGIPDHILLKPGPLNEEEWKLMRLHPEYAYRLLADIPYLAHSLDIPYCHHEKWDGSGYPRGLSGEEIPLAARIFAIVDIWDALLADRPYRKGWPRDRVQAHLLDLKGSHFDPQVVEAFLKLLSEQPSFGTGGLSLQTKRE